MLFFSKSLSLVLVLVLACVLSAVPANASGFQIGESSDDERRTVVSRVSYDEADGGRYSGSLRKKIRQLDDDVVEQMPVPVLFVSYAKLWPDFGAPRDGGARKHQGQDILAPHGAFIISPTDAVVTKVGKGKSAGIYVYTANPGGEVFAYMHLEKVAPGIKSGVVLKAGDLIGFVGDTGNAKGGPPHLHFEIRDGRKAVDPYPRLAGAFTQQEQVRILLAIVEILKKLA